MEEEEEEEGLTKPKPTLAFIRVVMVDDPVSECRVSSQAVMKMMSVRHMQVYDQLRDLDIEQTTESLRYLKFSFTSIIRYLLRKQREDFNFINVLPTVYNVIVD